MSASAPTPAVLGAPRVRRRLDAYLDRAIESLLALGEGIGAVRWFRRWGSWTILAVLAGRLFARIPEKELLGTTLAAVTLAISLGPPVISAMLPLATVDTYFSWGSPLIAGPTGANVRLSDFVLFVTFSQLLVRRRFGFLSWSVRHPLGKALWLWLGSIALAIGVTTLRGEAPLGQQIVFLHRLLFYVQFWVLLDFFERPGSARQYHTGLKVLTVVLTTIMLAQEVMGSTVEVFWGGARLVEMEGTHYLRVIPEGLPLLMMCTLIQLCELSTRPFRTWKWTEVALASYFVLGVLLTFTRSIMGPVFFGALLCPILLGGKAARDFVKRLFMTALAGTVLAMIALATSESAQDFASAMMHRLLDDVVGYRSLEVISVLPKYVQHWFWGVGFSTVMVTSGDRSAVGFTTFLGNNTIHNGFLMLLWHGGVFMFLGFFNFWLRYLIGTPRMWRGLRSTEDRVLVTANWIAVLGFLIGMSVWIYGLSAPSILPMLGAVAALAAYDLHARGLCEGPGVRIEPLVGAPVVPST